MTPAARQNYDICFSDEAFFALLAAVLYHVRIAQERGLSQHDAVMEAATEILQRIKAHSGNGNLYLGEKDPDAIDLNPTTAKFFALGLTMGAHFERIGLSFFYKADGTEIN